jgi:hypothetical protein
MTERQRALLNRARQALESARRLHAYGDTEGAINRACYRCIMRNIPCIQGYDRANTAVRPYMEETSSFVW